MIYVGLDLSLTGTGVAVLAPGEAPRLTVIGTGSTGPFLAARLGRLTRLVAGIVEFITPLNAAGDQENEYLFYVEAPTYATNTGSQHDRSGLWWLVVQEMLRYGRVIEVSPTKVKAFATGSGTASKAGMMAATAQLHPGVAFKDDNDSDALWLATLAEYVADPDNGRLTRTNARDKAASAVPRS